MRDRRRPIGLLRGFEMRYGVLAIALAVLAFVSSGMLILQLPLDWRLRGLLFVVVGAALILLCKRGLDSMTEPLRALSSIVEAYRSGDYTIRGTRDRQDDALGDLVNEINLLGAALHSRRLQAVEATALLDELIIAIDVAILAFDADEQLRLLNPAGCRLLALDSEAAAIGRTASALSLQEFLAAGIDRTIATTFAGRAGRWQVTHGTFREGGRTQHLLIIADVYQALREEERSAWQRLIRVITHEVNNSLTPIKSLADTLQDLVGSMSAPAQVRAETLNALQMIGDRSVALARFIAQYSRLARVAPPRQRWQPLAPVLARVAALDHMHRVDLHVADGLQALVDEDQLEQALINLAKNAIEACADTAGRVTITAAARASDLVITIDDDGPGIANLDNLFVPLFTTKGGGSGTGLVLSRQIAEGHGGTLVLENRRDAPRGARATLEIPRAARTTP